VNFNFNQKVEFCRFLFAFLKLNWTSPFYLLLKRCLLFRQLSRFLFRLPVFVTQKKEHSGFIKTQTGFNYAEVTRQHRYLVSERLFRLACPRPSSRNLINQISGLIACQKTFIRLSSSFVPPYCRSNFSTDCRLVRPAGLFHLVPLEAIYR